MGYRYRASVAALMGGLVLLTLVLVLNGCQGQDSPPATATPTWTVQVSAVPTETPTVVPAKETSAPTAAAIPPTSIATAIPPTATSVPTAVPSPAATPSPVVMVSPTVTLTEVLTGDLSAVTATAGVSEPTSAATVQIVPTVTDPASPFYNTVWVGLYGTPAGRGLGILGTATATETVVMAVQQAAAYQALAPDIRVVPFFHMVVTIADAHPGNDGNYVHRVSDERLQLWIDVARANGLLCVLDIQPGYSPLETELAFVDPFLRQPGVHLALDPEFLMVDGVSAPGQKIGMMTGAQVNQAQAWLDTIAAETGERKVLVIHQFDDRMFSGKEEIVDYPAVELVWDADGFGGPGAKIGDYQQYAAEPGFEHGGFKLFYDYDVPLMAPEQVLGLSPLPAFLVYQ